MQDPTGIVLNDITQKDDFNALLTEGTVENSFQDLYKKTIITKILCREEIKDIALFWNHFLGRHLETIRERLVLIGIQKPSEQLISEIKKRLQSQYARASKKRSFSVQTDRDVFENYQRKRGLQLRCEICGYHFRERDLSPQRLAVAEEFNFSFAYRINENRLNDQYKPFDDGSGEQKMLKLEIDHEVPVSFLGSYDPENLLILCFFCNRGKHHYTYPAEALPSFLNYTIASEYDRNNDPSFLMTTVVSAFRIANGMCKVTSVSNREDELTVINDQSKMGEIGPWRFRVVSYKYLQLIAAC
jgi:hypothetical protein